MANNSAFKFEELNKYNYQKSDDVKKLQQNQTDYANKLANYGDFNYLRQQDYDKALNAKLNQGKFSYDLNGDALYQQYKENYINQGKQAMMDTMGQAAAMTGGYGNSYAATVGNQTYQGYLQNLNNMIPQLQQMALDRYNAEANRLNENFSLLSADRESALKEHELGRSNIKDLLSYYTDAYNTEARLDLDNYNNKFTADNDAIKYKNDTGYKVYRDGIDDDRYAEDTKYKKEQDDIANALAQKQYKLQANAQKIAELQAGATYDKNGNVVSVAQTTGGTTTKKVSTGGASLDNIKDKLSGMTSNGEMDEYLISLEQQGLIDEDERADLYAEYKIQEQKGIKDRTWTMTDDGGYNWFGIGIDANAKYKDQYGQEYTLGQIRTELKKLGMSTEDANAWIKDKFKDAH